jgi:hypothetical protein
MRLPNFFNYNIARLWRQSTETLRSLAGLSLVLRLALMLPIIRNALKNGHGVAPGAK